MKLFSSAVHRTFLKFFRLCIVCCFRGEGRDSRWARQVRQVRQLAAAHVSTEEEYGDSCLRVLVPRKSDDQL